MAAPPGSLPERSHQSLGQYGRLTEFFTGPRAGGLGLQAIFGARSEQIFKMLGEFGNAALGIARGTAQFEEPSFECPDYRAAMHAYPSSMLKCRLPPGPIRLKVFPGVCCRATSGDN